MAADDRLGASVSRRKLLARAGTCAVVAGVAVGGCGSSARRPPVVAEFNGADADVVNAVLGAANRKLAAYAHAAGLLGGAHRALVQRLHGQAVAHVNALTGETMRLGGRPTAALADYGFAARDGAAALVLAAEVEDASIAAAIDAMAKIGDLEARRTVVAIANTDAQHAVLIAQARRLPALAVALVRGRA